MAQILGPEGGGVLTPQEKRRSLPAQTSRDRSRRGSRESLDSCHYDAGDEVSVICRNVLIIKFLLIDCACLSRLGRYNNRHSRLL